MRKESCSNCNENKLFWKKVSEAVHDQEKNEWVLNSEQEISDVVAKVKYVGKLQGWMTSVEMKKCKVLTIRRVMCVIICLWTERLAGLCPYIK